MTSLRPIALLIALGMLPTSCGVASAPCTFDSECGAQRRCVAQRCYSECEGDESCAEINEAATCQAIDRGEELSQTFNVCAVEDLSSSPPDVKARCEEDQFCRELLADERARCGLLERCLIPAEQHALWVVDLSDGQRGGAALLGAYLLDERGEWIAPLEIESYSPRQPADGEEAPSGWPPPREALDEAGECAMEGEPIEALGLGGEGGSVRLFYRDDEGQRGLLEAGWQVVIIERGASCGAEERDDAYAIKLCLGLEGDERDDTSQCERTLAASATGRTLATVSFDR